MELAELLKILNKINDDVGGKVSVLVDHVDFDFPALIESVEIGESYNDPKIPILYIYAKERK